MEILLGALLIFAMRVLDVSVGTIRVLFVMRGRKWTAAILGLFEAAIFVAAVSKVVTDLDLGKMVGYAAGYATGVLVGISIEQWIGAGQVVVRIITREHAVALRDRLFAEGFGVTAVRAEGRQREVLLLFIVCHRRRADALMTIADEIDPSAFVTVDEVSEAFGGYMRPMAVRGLGFLKK
jgi:uncharacterized protein YebE (UPF0316 family)